MLQKLNGIPKYKEKSKAFVVSKLVECLENGKINEQELTSQICEILLERDYNNVGEILEEYRKSEIDKKLEKENEPVKQVELITKRLNAKNNLKRKKYRCRRVMQK